MIFSLPLRRACCAVIVTAAALCPIAQAAEHVTLKNGFGLDCSRREIDGDRVRLYLADSASFLEVASTAILRTELLPDAPASVPLAVIPATPSIPDLLAHAGQQHRIDADMLASVVHAESGGHPHAVSRTGARGLMQLMPATATQLGVKDSFEPDQNIDGGTAYLDQLLTRYHDNIALALAAYNAGPGAVDRYHGIPPYRETQLYVARVINEFNRRKQLTLAAK